MPSENHLKSKPALFAIFSIYAALLAISCKECPTEPDYDIYLSVEDVFCTSVTLKVTLPDSGKINTFALERNDSTVATYTCYDDDTLITDDGLTPDTDYAYRVRFLKNGKTQAQSDPINIHTMLTTNHDFIWEIDTLGIYGSYLKDAWIVDENDIWVVGNIETDSGTFNVAKWDGEKWETIKVLSGYSPNYSIWYFNENDIWVCSGFPIHWDGEVWTLYHLQNMGLQVSVEHIWASSPSDIYFVGRKGSIVHYDGSTFTKIESGSDSPIVDIWGIDETHIWATAKTNSVDDDHPDGYESVTFFSDGSRWIRKYVASPENSSEYSSTEIAGYMNSVWAYDNTLYISSRSGLWKESIRGGKGYLDHGGKGKPLDGRPFLIRGTANNDVYAFTRWGEFLHYNGESWYQDLTFNGVSVRGGDVVNDQVVMVGHLSLMHAIVVRGCHLN